MGSPVLIADSTGQNVIPRITYKLYGELERTSSFSNGPDITRYKFTGQEEDAETGLMYFQARFYDPTIGRFITSDSEFGGQGTQGFNLHMYATGNPVKFSDPTGHTSEEIGEVDEKGNELETVGMRNYWDKNERENENESHGVESARESSGESSGREHIDIDRGDRGDRGALGSSNATDNSLLNNMIVNISSSSANTAGDGMSSFLGAGGATSTSGGTLYALTAPMSQASQNQYDEDVRMVSDALGGGYWGIFFGRMYADSGFMIGPIGMARGPASLMRFYRIKKHASKGIQFTVNQLSKFQGQFAQHGLTP